MLVATYNVHRCRGTAGLFRPDRIAAVIAEIRPDLIALQEAQHYFRRRKGMLDMAWLEAELGLRPLLVPEAAPGEQGWRSNILLARREARVLRGPVGLRLGGWEPRGGILAELDLGHGAFRVATAHLSLGAARRRLQAARLLDALSGGAAPDLPTLLLGDFNERDARGGALSVLAPAFGVPPAAPSFPAFFPLLSLDRILARPPQLLRGLAVHDTPLARRASDHLPLTGRIDAAQLVAGSGAQATS